MCGQWVRWWHMRVTMTYALLTVQLWRTCAARSMAHGVTSLSTVNVSTVLPEGWNIGKMCQFILWTVSSCLFADSNWNVLSSVERCPPLLVFAHTQPVTVVTSDVGNNVSYVCDIGYAFSNGAVLNNYTCASTRTWQSTSSTVAVCTGGIPYWGDIKM